MFVHYKTYYLPTLFCVWPNNGINEPAISLAIDLLHLCLWPGLCELGIVQTSDRWVFSFRSPKHKMIKSNVLFENKLNDLYSLFNIMLLWSYLNNLLYNYFHFIFKYSTYLFIDFLNHKVSSNKSQAKRENCGLAILY